MASDHTLYAFIVIGIVVMSSLTALHVAYLMEAPHVDDDTITVQQYSVGDSMIEMEMRAGDVQRIDPLFRIFGAYPTASRYTAPDPVVTDLHQLLTIYMTDMDDTEKAAFLQRFVQDNVSYISDMDKQGISNYSQYPSETLYDRTGDCEDVAFLLYSLYTLSGLDAVIVEIPGHVSVGVAVDAEGIHVEADGRSYVLAEATGSSPLGSSSFDYSSYSAYRPVSIIIPELALLGSAFLVMFAGMLYQVRRP